MNDAIILSTFAIWLFYFILLYLDVLDNHNIKSFNELFRLNFKALTIIKLFLFITFIYFISFNNSLISGLLFTFTFLFFLTEYLSDINNKIDFTYILKHKKYIFILFFLSVTPIIFFFLTNNLEITYLIMYALVFFIYIIVDIIKIFLKLKPRNKNKI